MDGDISDPYNNALDSISSTAISNSSSQTYTPPDIPPTIVTLMGLINMIMLIHYGPHILTYGDGIVFKFKQMKNYSLLLTVLVLQSAWALE